MRSHWCKMGPKAHDGCPCISTEIQTQRHTQGKGAVKMEEETGAMLSTTRGLQAPPEARKNQQGSVLEPSEGTRPC